MTYHLGVDLGTTITTAAVARDGKVGVVTLGEHSAAMPSVLYWGASGPPLVGDAAVRAAATDPSRAAREVRPRVADPTPLLLDGAPFAATALLGAMLRRVVDLVAEREGGAPDGIVLTHPATWGDEEQEAFAGVAVSLGLGAVSLVSEPEAAAARYAAREGLRDGGAVAVVDLGGGSVDATVLVHRGGAFTIAGRPEAVPYPTDAHPTDGAAVAGLHRALASARRLPGDLDAVVLVGWSTRTGAIAAALADELGRPVSLENEPEHTVALGAAGLAARGQQNGATTSVPVPRTQVVAARAARPRSAPPQGPRNTASLPSAPAGAHVPAPAPAPAPRRRAPRRGLTVGLAAGAIVLGIVGGGAFALDRRRVPGRRLGATAAGLLRAVAGARDPEPEPEPDRRRARPDHRRPRPSPRSPSRAAPPPPPPPRARPPLGHRRLVERPRVAEPSRLARDDRRSRHHRRRPRLRFGLRLRLGVGLRLRQRLGLRVRLDAGQRRLGAGRHDAEPVGVPYERTAASASAMHAAVSGVGRSKASRTIAAPVTSWPRGVVVGDHHRRHPGGQGRAQSGPGVLDRHGPRRVQTRGATGRAGRPRGRA